MTLVAPKKDSSILDHRPSICPICVPKSTKNITSLSVVFSTPSFFTFRLVHIHTRTTTGTVHWVPTTHTNNTMMMKLCFVLPLVYYTTTTTSAFLTTPSSFLSRHHVPTTSIFPLLPSSHQTFKQQLPQQQLTSTATPTAGEGGAMEAVPKKGIWGKVSTIHVQSQDSKPRAQRPADRSLTQNTPFKRYNPLCPPQKNVKSYFHSASCSFASYSTTRSLGIPRMYSWSPRQSRGPKLFHSSKLTSTYQRPLDLPAYMPA